MGFVEVTEGFTVLCGGQTVIIYNHRNTETRVLDIQNAVEKYRAKGRNGESKANVKSSCETQIVAAKVSRDGQYLAAACEGKMMVVWCCRTWDTVAVHFLVKRPMALALTRDSSTILMADKSGYVYELPVKGSTQRTNQPDPAGEEHTSADSADTGQKPLLGHLSMLLDVALSDDNQLVITSDRDEKIRVSHYPQAYDIHNFCLGHSEFVTQLALLPGLPHLLLSCSGDGTLRLWDYQRGECVCCLDTRQHTQHTPGLLQHYHTHVERKLAECEDLRRALPDYPAVRSVALAGSGSGRHLVAAILDQVPAIFIYKTEGRQLTHTATRPLTSTPHAAAWTQSEELAVMQGGQDPVAVFTLIKDTLKPLPDHPLVEIGRKYREHFEAWRDPLDLDVLYKQRYDNMADYLKKKEERLANEKAAQEGLVPTVKKGRWGKK